jgi:hypothetical protein
MKKPIRKISQIELRRIRILVEPCASRSSEEDELSFGMNAAPSVAGAFSKRIVQVQATQGLAVVPSRLFPHDFWALAIK